MFPANQVLMFACARESMSARRQASPADPDLAISRSGLFRFKRHGERAIRIRQQVQELHFRKVADQLETRERRVVDTDSPEVREFEPHEMAQDGADDIAVR